MGSQYSPRAVHDPQIVQHHLGRHPVIPSETVQHDVTGYPNELAIRAWRTKTKKKTLSLRYFSEMTILLAATKHN